jgi:hypothetical protein
MINAPLLFVIDALRFVFDAARTLLDVDLDTDMQHWGAVSKQCLDLSPSSSTKSKTREGTRGEVDDRQSVRVLSPDDPSLHEPPTEVEFH